MVEVEVPQHRSLQRPKWFQGPQNNIVGEKKLSKYLTSTAHFLCKRRVNMSVCASLDRRSGATESYLPRRPITAHAASIHVHTGPIL